jgi:hypothetical protein
MTQHPNATRRVERADEVKNLKEVGCSRERTGQARCVKVPEAPAMESPVNPLQKRERE